MYPLTYVYKKHFITLFCPFQLNNGINSNINKLVCYMYMYKGSTYETLAMKVYVLTFIYLRNCVHSLVFTNGICLFFLMQRVRARKYQSRDDFQKDVQQIVDNSTTYNGAKSALTMTAQNMLLVCKKKFLEVCILIECDHYVELVVMCLRVDIGY